MKKWISLITCVACALSSTVYGEGSVAATETRESKVTVQTQELIAQNDTPQSRRQAGKAASDGSETSGNAGLKYGLIAVVVAGGITAAVLLSRSHGGHHHSHHSHSSQSH